MPAVFGKIEAILTEGVKLVGIDVMQSGAPKVLINLIQLLYGRWLNRFLLQKGGL